MTKIIFIITSLLLMAAQCGSPGGEKTSGHLYREIDEEASVVCYHFAGSGNIDCLPISETKLEEK